MRAPLRVLVTLALFLLAACTDASVLQPSSPESALGPASAEQGMQGAQRVAVMSRNLYVGADVDAVIGALASPDPNDDIPALLTAIGTLQATDFPTRAAAIAGEIARGRPHMVGLQEVFTISVNLTPLGLPIVVDVDFLPVLQSALATRGLNYSVATVVTTTQASPFPGISLIDHDAMLVDADRVTVGVTTSQVFTYNIGVVAPGVDIKRGWVTAEVVIDGQPYTLANTHLESGNSPGLDQLRAAQAQELAISLGTKSPVVVTGDFNDVPGSLMYQVMAGAGFTDVWAGLRPRVAGLTCCHVADLSNERPVFTQRIDYVFARGTSHPIRGVQGRVDLIGDARSDRIRGPLHPIWPSDHAGIVAELLSPPAHGLRE